VPWEIATYLLGAQGGAEADFARLYEATNPILVRYLRVTTDAEGEELAELALGTWTTALPQLMACPPDEDAWLELVIDSARVVAAGRLRAGDGSAALVASAGPAAGPAAGDLGAADPSVAAAADVDGVDHAIEALRACPPAEADVLAMGLVANLDRDATARLTDHEPTAVLALVQEGQEHLPMSLDALSHALRSPARAGEVADVALVTPLITAALEGPAPTVASHEDAAHVVIAPGALAAALAATGATAGAPLGGVQEPSLAALLGMESAAAVSSNVVPLAAVRAAAGTPSRSARVGIGAGVWLLAVGGVGTAAAMSGLITEAIDGIFGHHGRPLVTAQGPATPGKPSPRNTPAVPGTGSRPGSTGRPGTAAEPPTAGGGGTQSVSLPGTSRTTEIVLASFVLPATPSTPATTPSTPTTPTTPSTPTTPTTPPVAPPPVSSPGASGGNGHGSAPETRKAARQAKATAKATAKASRATTKAAKAAARAAVKGQHTARGTGHQGKALGHDKNKAKGNAVGHDQA
jgi:DNA-directed RNA polymerase specialized sigma24 family protein